jgi:hypothetical protein
MRPSLASRNSTRVETPIVPAHDLPSPNRSFSPSSGTSTVSCLAVASPRCPIAASVFVVTHCSQRSPRPGRTIPCSSSMRISRRRSAAANAFVQASSMTAAMCLGTTNSVRRMPSIRTSERRSYSASSRSPGLNGETRAHADRCTVEGSLECSPTTASAACSGDRAGDASRCRRPSRARRSATWMVRTAPRYPRSPMGAAIAARGTANGVRR